MKPKDDLVLTCRTSARSYIGFYLVLALLAAGAWAAAWFQAVAVPSVALVAAGIVLLLVAAIHVAVIRASTLYRVFRTSLELRRGIVSRRIDNLQLFRLRDLSVAQGLAGRLLGVGDVILTSTDATTPRLVLRGVRDPVSVYDTLRTLVSESQATRQTMIVEREHS